VTEKLLDTWGDLSVKDGYIQRSAVPPSSFTDPDRFLSWYLSKHIELINDNNLL